jgi:HlyD family secretion protein
MRWRRRGIQALIVGTIIALLVLGLRPSPVLVDTAPVSRGYLAVTVEEEGRTRVIDRYVLSAPILAQARRISHEVGDRIAAGEVLATLDAVAAPALDVRTVAEARARVAAAEAGLEVARQEAEAAAASAQYAQAEQRRLQQLAERRLLAESQAEQAAAEAQRAAALHRSAEFRAKTAAFELEAARTALTFAGGQDPQREGVFELHAPVAGRVLKRYFESARVVNPGEPILEVGNPAALEVEIEVLSSDAVRLSPDMKVLFERWGQPEPLEGQIKRIEPSGFTKISALGVEEQRVLVIADITSPPEQWVRLGDAYRVNARFILWENPAALRVPTSALFRHGDGWAVFLVDGNRARLRHVTVGKSGGGFSEVEAGLAEQEVVIVHPDRDLKEDMRIKRRVE